MKVCLHVLKWLVISKTMESFTVLKYIKMEI